MGLDSSVSKGTGFRFSAREWQTVFFHVASRKSLSSTQPPSQSVPRSLSVRVKQPGGESDHSPVSSSEVKNSGVLYVHSILNLHGVVFN